jgi:16S rRNA G527 N7-methylase RsmG
VDIGSGAGFPGLIVALAWPQTEMTLVEPAQKRASFLRLAIAELGLGARVRVASPPASPAPLVLSRATFSRTERAPLGAAVAEGGTLWLWSVAAEQAAWADEAGEIGLRAIAPLTREIEGEARVILRAVRQQIG